MKCPKCGSDVDDKANFCPNCGFKLKINIEALKIKINDFRHKIYEGYISMALGLGLVFFGVWLGVSFWRTRYEWRGWTLYKITYSLFKEPALILIAVGLVVFILGGIYCAYYDYKKGKLLKQLERD